MPPGRANRGGRRKPQQGATYQNRTDLQTRQPVQTTPGQVYGKAAAQANAQKVVPLPGPGAQPSPDTTMAGAGPQPPASLGQGPMPGELGPLHAPTDRPGEPVTHGLPTGPGAGPEVLQPPNPLVKAAAVLNNLGSAADAETQKLRTFINAQLGNTSAA